MLTYSQHSVVVKWTTYFPQDILENEDVKLDHMFMASLIADIVKVRLTQLLFHSGIVTCWSAKIIIN